MNRIGLSCLAIAWAVSQADTASAANESNLYAMTGNRALWTRDGKILPQTAELRQALSQAPAHGLPSLYWTPELEGLYQHWAPEQASRFDGLATEALVRYATHLMNGRVNPAGLGDEVKIKAKTAPLEAVAVVLKSASGDLRSRLETLAPQWPLYRDLQAALARLAALDPKTAWPEVRESRRNARLGDQAEVFGAVKTRLRTLGYPVAETGPVYTQELADLVRRYVSQQALPGPTDLSSEVFWSHISVSLGARVQQIRLSLEKLRWLPHAPESRHLFENVALQRLRVYENGRVVLRMNTVNGQPSRMTPTLRDQITRVELNPDWVVPKSIIVQDKAPMVLKDPNYLSDHHFVIWDDDFNRKLNRDQVDWQAIARARDPERIPIYLQQQPGLDNGLGVLKFHLTNPYAIYFHDTDDRELFRQNYRLVSSGCVRLERPAELARYLLRDDAKWGVPGRIEASLARTPLADPSVPRELEIKLKSPLPVYLLSITADLDDNGVLLFANDYYGQDTRLFEALKTGAR